ncbi:MAG: hypothetical protein AABY13_05225, partial [Nanoarchaeota archaeon]
KRALIPQGSGGLTIYLPKRWVARKGLEGGDQVDVFESDTKLVIGAAAAKDREKEITITKENRGDVQTLLTHAYRTGAERIVLRGVDEKLLPQVRKTTEELLLGFELARQDDTVTLENVFEPVQEKYDAVLRRLFLIIKESIELLVRNGRAGAYDAREMASLRQRHDKYALFCRRLLMKELHGDDIVLSWELLTFLVHVEHALAYCHAYAAASRLVLDARMLALTKAFKDYFGLYYDAFYTNDMAKVHAINDLKDRYQFGECIKALEASRGKKTVYYAYLRELFRLVQVGSSPIVAMKA